MMFTLISQAMILQSEDGELLPYNPDDVTPGVIGFAFTVVIAVAIILLGLDLYRRVRRMNYRGEARESIATELAESNEAQEQQEGSSDNPRVD